MALISSDLRIYYSGNAYVSGMCSRWDCSDYTITMEMWLKKGPLLTLMDNIRPGAVRELKRVVYSPKFYDSTWRGYNTLRLKPVVGTELYRMRGREKIIYPKSISSSPLPGVSGWIATKIESCVSGGSI